MKLCPFCGSQHHTRIEDCPNIDPEQLREAADRRNARARARRQAKVTLSGE